MGGYSHVLENFSFVEHKTHGSTKYEGLPLNGFVSYLINSKDEMLKVVNYSQDWLKHGAIEMRKGYSMREWKGTSIAVAELARANKYLNKQYIRIANKLEEGDIERAVVIWRILHTRSKLWSMVLLVRRINFLELPVRELRNLLRKIRRKMRREDHRLRHKRVFLTEYNLDGSVKKYRPLGVPAKEWRVIAASYEFLLVNVWKKTWSKNQYACMPKKGTVDAWMRILIKLAQGDVNEIIGYDLAKFFDLVYVRNISKMLEDLPKHLTDYFEKLVRRKAKVKREDERLEKERLAAAEAERPETVVGWEGYKFILEEGLENLEGGITRASLKREAIRREAPYISFPQGLNTSPIMCCRALQNTGALDHPNIVQYVDDGVILNTTEKRLTLEEFKRSLHTSETSV
jgi:hypothetical protein